MKIALINPPTQDRYVHGIDEPLGILYLASQLKDKHEVLIIDSFSHKLSIEESLEVCMHFEPDVVGLSTVFSTTYKTSKEICEKIKKLNSKITTIIGGNTATFMADELAPLSFIDYVVRGEGDISLPLLIEALENDEDVSKIKGISYVKDNKISHNPDQPPVKDLDTLPFPARDLLPMSKDYPKSILSARGCAYGCSYCSTAAFWGKGFRTRSVDNIIEEIQTLNQDDELSFFSFADDCFTLVPKRAKEICKRLKDMKLNAKWSCTGRIETITDELLNELSSAGCESMFFGIESGSERILRKLNRFYTRENVVEAYRLCLANGIKPYFSFIIGLPFEDASDIEQTYELISRLEGVESGIHMLTPFPGTPMVEDPSKYELDILNHSIEDLDLNTKSYIKTNKLSTEEIEKAYKKAVGYSFRALKRTKTISKIQAEVEGRKS